MLHTCGRREMRNGILLEDLMDEDGLEYLGLVGTVVLKYA
jgi:hypothetical protein